MAKAAYHKPDNVVLFDQRGVDTSQVRFPPEGCCQPNPHLMLALRFYAEKAIKAHWKAQGIRVQYCTPGEVRKAAEQYLTEHWRDLLPQAQQLVDRVERAKSIINVFAVFLYSGDISELL